VLFGYFADDGFLADTFLLANITLTISCIDGQSPEDKPSA